MDYNHTKAVPFKIDEISGGFQEAKGLLNVEEKGISLEFEVSDALVGVFKSGVKNVFIPFADLNSITYKKGWIGAKIILEGTSMKVFDEVPGTDVATCTLKIKRKHRDEAQTVSSRARVRLSEYRLRQLDEGE